jgi:hypothetical protein
MRSHTELATIGGDRIRVFVSYDRDADEDLFDLLAEKASKQSCRFEITARSNGESAAESEGALRRAIREADQVIVICGEHTQDSVTMSAELRAAQEEERPYVLLWGRRERMCTKPMTARSADAIYSWTREVLERQLLTALRAAWSHEQRAEFTRQRLARAAKPAPASGALSARGQLVGVGRLCS